MIDDAAVRVSLVCFPRADDATAAGARLDGRPVDEIHTALTGRRGGAGVDLTGVRRLPQTAGVAFTGDTKGGHFEVVGDWAREWLRLPANPNGRTNADILKPWVNGMGLTSGRRGSGAGQSDPPEEPPRSLPVPIPAGLTTRRYGRRLPERLPGRRHPGSGPPARRGARPLAQPARMGQVAGRADSGLPEAPVPRNGDAAKGLNAR